MGEAAKADDEAKKNIITLKNDADQYVYNTEKQLTEHSARLPDSVKDQVRGDISSLNEAIVSEDADKISEALEKLKNSSMRLLPSVPSTPTPTVTATTTMLKKPRRLKVSRLRKKSKPSLMRTRRRKRKRLPRRKRKIDYTKHFVMKCKLQARTIF